MSTTAPLSSILSLGDLDRLARPARSWRCHRRPQRSSCYVPRERRRVAVEISPRRLPGNARIERWTLEVMSLVHAFLRRERIALGLSELEAKTPTQGEFRCLSWRQEGETDLRKRVWCSMSTPNPPKLRKTPREESSVTRTRTHPS